MARVEVYAGICGFTTRIFATSQDKQHVLLQIESDCPDVCRARKQLNGLTVDAFQEIGPCAQPGSLYDTTIHGICGDQLPHVACPVPAGICKAVEVAAGLALPRDAHIRVFPDEPETAQEDV